MINTFKKPHFVFVRQMPPIIVWGGLEKLMLDWFERIDFDKCQVTLVVSTGGAQIYKQYTDKKNISLNIIEFPFRKEFQYVDNFYERFSKSLACFKTLKPDMIFFFQGSYVDFDLAVVIAGYFSAKGNVYMHENLGAAALSPRTSKKYLGFISGMGLWWYMEKYGTRGRAYFSKKIVSVSHEVKERLVSLRGYPQDKIDVRYHGIDLSTFKPCLEKRHDMRKSLGINANQKVIIVTARLAQEKCLHRLIEAFETVSPSYPNMVLLIAGNGPLEEKLKALATSQRTSSQIKFLGHVDNVCLYLQMSDIYVLPSDNEGFGIALVEALACGLICLATKCPGPNEIIKDGINGFLVDKNTQSVTQGLIKILSLSELEEQQIRKNALEDAHQRFDINPRIHDAFNAVGIPYAN